MNIIMICDIGIIINLISTIIWCHCGYRKLGVFTMIGTFACIVFSLYLKYRYSEETVNESHKESDHQNWFVPSQEDDEYVRGWTVDENGDAKCWAVPKREYEAIWSIPRWESRRTREWLGIEECAKDGED